MKTFALTTVVLITIYCLLFTVNLFRADVAFNNGGKFSRYGLYEIATEDYRKAISLNPSEPRYHRELANVLAALAQGGVSSEERGALIEEAEREAEIAYNLNPKNSLTVRSLVSTYVDLADFDPKYLMRAEELIAEAVAWQTTNPQLYYEQALILFKAEKDEEALAALQKAVELKPDYQKARELLEPFQRSSN